MRTPNTISTGTQEGMPISVDAQLELLQSTRDALKKCAIKIGKAVKKAKFPNDNLYCVPFVVTNNFDCIDPEVVALISLALIGRGDAMAVIYASRSCPVCNEIAKMPHVAIVDGFRRQLQLYDSGKIPRADCQSLIELVREAIEP